MAGPSETATDPAVDDRFERIWSVVEGIPEGCVLNYGEVARLAGLKGKARLVGMALGRAPKRRGRARGSRLSATLRPG
ncbi:MAG: hypothetical protein GVY13_05500 [Alphaproteobacteria bacterium]|nr:hypothetical protein [Alphaproteobacteria bacterium]